MIEFRATDRALSETAADYKAPFKITHTDAAAPAKETKTELASGDPKFKPLEKERSNRLDDTPINVPSGSR